jgi:hypothetical protein
MSLQSWSQKSVGNVSYQLALVKKILHLLKITKDYRSLGLAEEWLRKNQTFVSKALFLAKNHRQIEI